MVKKKGETKNRDLTERLLDEGSDECKTQLNAFNSSDTTNTGFVLTKEEAEKTTLRETESGAPMSLFDLFLHEIGRELNRRQEPGPYKKDAKELMTLHTALTKAEPQTDIKDLVRRFLNQKDLSAEYSSEENFWDTIRFSLNQTLKFQPPFTPHRDHCEISEKKPGFIRSFFSSSASSPERVEPRSYQDRCNVTSREIKEDRHAMVENSIRFSQIKREVNELGREEDADKTNGQRLPF